MPTSHIEKPKRKTPPGKRRVRTGCLTCRSKHKKCDEHKPVCNFCKEKGYKCIWHGPKKLDYAANSLRDLLSFENSTKSIVSMLSQPIPISLARPAIGKNGRSFSISATANSNPEMYIGDGFDSDYVTNSAKIGSISMTRSLSDELEQQASKVGDPTVKRPTGFYKLPKTLASILEMHMSLHGEMVDSTVLNNQCVFEIFTDKSISSVRLADEESMRVKYHNLLSMFNDDVLDLICPQCLSGSCRSQFANIVSNSALPMYAALALTSRILEENMKGYKGEHTLDFYNGALQELAFQLKGDPKEITDQGRLSILFSVLLMEIFEILSADPSQCNSKFDIYYMFLLNYAKELEPGPASNILLGVAGVVQLIVFSFKPNMKVPPTVITNSEGNASKVVAICLEIEAVNKEDSEYSYIDDLVDQLLKIRSSIFEPRTSEIYLSVEDFASTSIYCTAAIQALAIQINSGENKGLEDQLKARLSSLVDRLIGILKRNMGWKNSHSVGGILDSIYAIRKTLQNNHISETQRKDLIKMSKVIGGWSRLSIFMCV